MLLVLSYKPNNCLCSTAECTCIWRLKSHKKGIEVRVGFISVCLYSLPAIQLKRWELCDALKWPCRFRSKNKNVTLLSATICKCDIYHWLLIILQVDCLLVQIASEPREKLFQINKFGSRGTAATIIEDESQFLACGCFTCDGSHFWSVSLSTCYSNHRDPV